MNTSILNSKPTHSEATNSAPDSVAARPEILPSVSALQSLPSNAVAASQPLGALAPVGSRCLHRYANGKRCRLPGVAALSGYCTRHIYIGNVNVAVGLPFTPVPSDSEDLSAELLPELSQPDSPLPIKQFLTRILILLAKGRITPRRAAVLSYLTNQLHVCSRRPT